MNNTKNNNSNMDDLIKKAQEMIKTNQIPAEIKQLMNNMQNSTSNLDSKKSGENSTNALNNIDLDSIKNVVNKLNLTSSDDDMSRLLSALKPYLRNERKEKVDSYIKLIRMGKIAQMMDLFGGDKK